MPVHGLAHDYVYSIIHVHYSNSLQVQDNMVCAGSYTAQCSLSSHNIACMIKAYLEMLLIHSKILQLSGVVTGTAHK